MTRTGTTVPVAPATRDDILKRRLPVVPMVLWALVGILSAACLYVVAGETGDIRADRLAAGAWIGSVLLGMALVCARALPAGPGGSDSPPTVERTGLLAMAAIMIAAIAVRTMWLPSHPYPWSGDEASVGTYAAHMLAGQITGYFRTGWSGQPNGSFVPTAIAELLLGRNILAVRAPSVLAGTLAVLFVYLLGRELFGRRTALVGAALLATLPYHVHFSRIGVHNVIDSLMSTVVFWLLARAVARNDARYYYAAGVAAGLCLYTYTGTRLVLPLAAGMLGLLMVYRRRLWRVRGKGLLVFCLAAFISSAPQALFFAKHPDILMDRLGAEGILFNGWLVQEAARNGTSVWAVLFDQFARTCLVFVASPARGNMFNAPGPYLTIAGSALFLTGMAVALAHWRNPRYALLPLWFLAVVILGGVLTLNPPANTRLLMTSAPLVLLAGLGANSIAEFARRAWGVPDRVVAAALTAVLCLITYQQASFYLDEYRARMYFQDANAEYAQEVGFIARDLGPGARIYVMGAPRVFASFPTMAFLAPEHPRRDLDPAEAPALQLAPGERAGFFATPENTAALAAIRQRYPQGKGGVVYRRTKDGEVLLEYFVVEARD